VFEAGKRCAFSAAMDGPEQLSDGHDRHWQRKVGTDVPARIGEKNFVTVVNNVPARVRFHARQRPHRRDGIE
jgi:hypothetical protein